MYRIKNLLTNRYILTNHTFFTYERARQAARKEARKMRAKGKLYDVSMGFWDDISRNPTTLKNVFAIVRVD